MSSYSDEELDAAVAQGVLSEASARAFRDYVAQLRQTPAVDEENFRLVTGFNDIFVVIASVLLLISVGWIGSSTVEKWFGALAIAAVAWGLSEFFTRKRRMALPSMVLMLVFVGAAFSSGLSLMEKQKAAYVVATALAAGAAWLHWQRFRVPITVAAGVAAVAGLGISFLIAFLPESRRWLPLIVLVVGLLVFGLAMRWDGADPLRQTRNSDVAFWLHLLAAPLLVHPVFATISDMHDLPVLLQAVVVIALYLAISLVSLLIDRRALMVSALGYVLYVFTALLKQFGFVSLGFAITALAIGSALLLLSAFWHATRSQVVRHFPKAWQVRLPPLH